MKHTPAIVPGWSNPQKLGLGVACLAVFTTIILVAGRELPAVPTATLSTAKPARAQPASALTFIPMESPLPGSGPHEVLPPHSRGFTPVQTPPVESTIEPEQVSEWARQAMPLRESTAEENEERRDTLRKLGAVGSPEAIAALAYALRSDADIRNRIVAVDQMRRMAMAGNRDPAIASILSDATRDDDTVMSAYARDALTQIEEARAAH